MSGNFHIHHTPGRYIGQARPSGSRKWVTLTGKRRTPQSALAGAAAKFSGYEYIRVLWVPLDPLSYYGPHIVIRGRWVA